MYNIVSTMIVNGREVFLTSDRFQISIEKCKTNVDLSILERLGCAFDRGID